MFRQPKALLLRLLTWLPLIAVVALPLILDAVAWAADTAEGVAPKASFFDKLVPILILLAVIGFVLFRLPKTDVGHSKAYIQRRVMNWLPLGLTYSLLYMGRYNLTVAKTTFGDVMSIHDFSTIFAVGTVVYGFSFVVNGPLTDKLGGRKTIMISAVGASIANLAMGLITYFQIFDNLVLTFSILYALNMYFQSFGAVSIVKVNAPWFHVRERGTFGAIFGILISLGIYFAFDVSAIILQYFSLEWVFFIPAIILMFFAVLDFFLVHNQPSDVGFEDFDPGDAQTFEGEERSSVVDVFRRMLTNPVIVTIAFIEFCSGFLRQSIMQYMPLFAKEMGRGNEFIFQHWGVFLACAGILGGVFAGVISDKVFGSRRGPVAATLYAMMLLGSIVSLFTYDTGFIAPLTVFMSMAIIGVHGILSGTASMDFGGRKNTGVAVGIIDGFVYLGTGVMAIVNGQLLPSSSEEGIHIASNWTPLFWVMIPVAAVGLILSLRIWNAHARDKSKA